MKSRKRKKRGENTEEALTLQSALTLLLSQALSGVRGTGETVSLSRIDFRGFEKTSENLGDALLGTLSTDAAEYSASFLIPGKTYKSILPSFRSVHPGREDDEFSLLRYIAGNVPRLLSLKDGSEALPGEDRLESVAQQLKASADDYTEQPSVFLPGVYEESDRQQFLWTFSGYITYEAVYKSLSFYIFISPGENARMSELFANSPGFSAAVRERVLVPFGDTDREMVQESVSTECTIGHPFDFVLGSGFLPHHAVSGKQHVYCWFRKIVLSSDNDPSSQELLRNCLWYRLVIQNEEKRYALFYGVDVKGNREKYRNFFEKLFRDLAARAVPVIKSWIPVQRAGGTIVTEPPVTLFGRSLILDALLRIGSQQLTCTVLVPRDFMTLLARNRCSPRLLNYTGTGLEAAGPLTEGMAVNRTLFRDEFETFSRRILETGTDKKDHSVPLRISQLIGFLGSEDIRRIVHSFLIGSGYGVSDMQRLFFYRSGTGEKSKTAVDPLFQNSSFMELLPRVPREEWSTLHAYSRSWDELLENNGIVMRKLLEAVEKEKIDLSFRARYLLFQHYGKKLEQEYRRLLDDLVQQGRHLSILEELTRPEAEQAVSAFSDRRLALALFSREKEAERFYPYISRNKQRELQEEFRVLRLRYPDEKKPWKDMAESLNELTVWLENVLVKDSEQDDPSET